MIKIETTCGCNVYPNGIGFFVEPEECSEEVEIELEGTFPEACEVYDFVALTSGVLPNRVPREDEEFTICFAVTCPGCKAELVWPQAWELVK